MRKKSRRIAMLITLIFMTTFLLVVSTYAWFIGMKTVNVSNFDVEIATTEGLYLSMDGKDWSYKLDAKGANLSSTYSTNTNTWAPDGLSPVSTVGDMDKTSSRLILFEKGSLTATPGGYRLLSSRVHNYDQDQEAKGYVAFDLFIKNLSGAEYYTQNTPANEEAVYLTTNSSVKVNTLGGGTAGTGIENSVRVAVTQVGRVEATDGVASVANIQAIKCADVSSGSNQAQVTGICRSASIWEPNDKAHVTNAINWYNTSCLPRTSSGADVTSSASYGTGTCGTVADGTPNKTYVISNAIQISNNVNVYDGVDYNGYDDDIIDYNTYAAADASTKAGYALVDYPFFTDSDKILTGASRPQFMTLAPNSITKLRVYIYIEGQDIDNYDFAQLGKMISVNFGFTKERYTETDIGYSGPSTNLMTESE